MKKCAVMLFLLLILTGCSGTVDEMKVGMDLRSKLLQASQCSFDARITADYGDKIHIFAMDCQGDSKGNLTFTVTEPDTISGITGILSGEGGKITFDETALHFDLLAEQQISPVSAPWILLRTLRSGYMTSACAEEGRVRLSIDDSYEENALRLDIWLDQENQPEHADILYDGRRIMSLTVDHFEIL